MRGLTPINIQPSPSDSDGERNSSVVDIERAGTDYGERGPKNELYDGEAEREEGDDRRTAEAEADDDWDLMRMLQQSAPPRHAHDRFAPGQGETVELVEESMASYLNRKTALLMLWFPLGVSRLSAVSLKWEFRSDDSMYCCSRCHLFGSFTILPATPPWHYVLFRAGSSFLKVFSTRSSTVS